MTTVVNPIVDMARTAGVILLERMSGGLDPVTPPANGELVAKSLSDSRHVIAAGYGHIVSPHACAPRLIEKFIDTAGFATLPQSCLDYLAASKRPPTFSSLLEPK